MNEKSTTNLINKIMYLICLVASGLLLLLACALHFTHVEFLDLIHFPCIILHYTGFYCPGCGMTRSISSLLQGHLIESFFYHPAVLCALFLDLCTLIGHFIYQVTGKKEQYFHFRMAYLYLLIGIIIAQWILKLIFQIL